MNTDHNWTTIEEVRGTISNTYDSCQLRTKIELKSWSYHSEKCHRNGVYPLPFIDYVTGMTDRDYLHDVQAGLLDCEDVGGKATVVAYLTKRIEAASD